MFNPEERDLGSQLITTYEKVQVVPLQMAYQLEEIVQALAALSRERNSLSQRDLNDRKLPIEESIDLWLREISSLSMGGRPSAIMSKLQEASRLRSDASYAEWRSYVVQFVQIGYESLDDMQMLLTDVIADPNLGNMFIEEMQEWTVENTPGRVDDEEYDLEDPEED